MSLTPFRIISKPPAASVEIDGNDVTHMLRRISVDLEADRGVVVPKLFLELQGEGELEGDGIVHVVQTEQAEPLVAVQEWLSNIDPDELERCMLEQFDGLTDMRTGQACMAVLKAWASGD